ncbi:MAG TPA: hypothetical protein VF874_20705 [Mycobacterium sp.]
MQQVQQRWRGREHSRVSGDDDNVYRGRAIVRDVGEQQQHRHQRADATDHRRRALDQRPGADPTGQHQRQPALQEPLVHRLEVRHSPAVAAR